MSRRSDPPTFWLQTIVFTLIILWMLFIGWLEVYGEGSYEVIPRPDGPMSPYVSPPNNTVGSGNTTEETVVITHHVVPCLAHYFPAHALMVKPFLDVNPKTKNIWLVGMYDRNSDGRVDGLTLTVPGTDFPRKYGVDLNFDQVMDVVWRDDLLNGTCTPITGIVLERINRPSTKPHGQTGES